MAVHLSIIFTLQSAIVVAAFAVVIWLLTSQQHTDLQRTIFRSIDQQQETAKDGIISPFLYYETPMRRYGERSRAFPNELSCLTNATLVSTSRLFEAIMLDVAKDGYIQRLSQYAQLENSFNAANGDRAVWGGCSLGLSEGLLAVAPITSPPVTTPNPTSLLNQRHLKAEVLSEAAKQRARVTRLLPTEFDTSVSFESQFPSAVTDYSYDGGLTVPSPTASSSSPYETVQPIAALKTIGVVNSLPTTTTTTGSSSSNNNINSFTSGYWMDGGLFVNKNRNNAIDYTSHYLLPLRWGVEKYDPMSASFATAIPANITTLGFVVDLIMTNLSSAVAEAKVAESSRVMLFEARSASLIATTIATIPLIDSSGRQWAMGQTPDSEMNEALRDALQRCPAPTTVGAGIPFSSPSVASSSSSSLSSQQRRCESVTYLSDMYVIALRHISTSSGISMILLQITPEEYFFSGSRKTRLNGIFVGAGAAVLVVITCIFIWLAVYGPLNSLQEDMLLAANMRNEKVKAKAGQRSCCLLYEIAMLNESFDLMNEKLLLARAYMPQALLLGGGRSGSSGAMGVGDDDDGFGAFENDDDDDDDDDEGDALRNSLMSSSRGRSSTTPSRSKNSKNTRNNVSAGGGERHANKHANAGEEDDDDDEGDILNLSMSVQNNNNHSSGNDDTVSQRRGGGGLSPRKAAAATAAVTTTTTTTTTAKKKNNNTAHRDDRSERSSVQQGGGRANNNNKDHANNNTGAAGGGGGTIMGGGGKYTLALSRAITSRRIGILIVNARDFHKVITGAVTVTATIAAVSSPVANSNTMNANNNLSLSLQSPSAVPLAMGGGNNPSNLLHASNGAIVNNNNNNTNNSNIPSPSTDPNGYLTFVHQQLVELIEGASKAEKGVIDSFQGDHFVITFNAAVAVGAPAKAAALCAIRIQNNVKPRTQLPGVTMGLSTGMAMVGTLGTSDLKKFCMITPAFTQAIALEMAAKSVIGVASCLFSMKLAGDLDMHVYSQLVGQKYLQGTTNINQVIPATTNNNNNTNDPPAAATPLQGKVVNVAGIMAPITTQGDEWLYELEEGASKNPYAKINAAYELFFAGEFERCEELLSAGPPQNADVGMCANWIRLQNILKHGTTEWQL